MEKNLIDRATIKEMVDKKDTDRLRGVNDEEGDVTRPNSIAFIQLCADLFDMISEGYRIDVDDFNLDSSAANWSGPMVRLGLQIVKNEAPMFQWDKYAEPREALEDLMMKAMVIPAFLLEMVLVKQLAKPIEPAAKMDLSKVGETTLSDFVETWGEMKEGDNLMQYLINLLGERQPQIRSLLHDVSELVVRKHVGDGDVMIQDMGGVVMMMVSPSDVREIVLTGMTLVLALIENANTESMAASVFVDDEDDEQGEQKDE